MDRYPFAVNESPFCVWEHDLAERNLRFLSNLDPDYFTYQAETYGAVLEGDNGLRAAVSLRAAYHHGLESLFSLLGAMTQAPGCVLGWLPKCSNLDLRAIVTALSNGTPLLTQRGRQRVTLSLLAEAVHANKWVDEQPPKATAQRFATMWRRFASDFLDEHQTEEYNSLKHGFRVAAGGFTLRVGIEAEYGVPAPEETMQTLGASPYGSTFFIDEPVLPEPAPKFHFRARRFSLNWRAESMVIGLQMLGTSINNVVGALRCMNGAPPGTMRFLRPEDPSAYEAPWRMSVGVTSVNWDTMIDPTEVTPATRAELKSELEART